MTLRALSKDLFHSATSLPLKGIFLSSDTREVLEGNHYYPVHMVAQIVTSVIDEIVESRRYKRMR